MVNRIVVIRKAKKQLDVAPPQVKTKFKLWLKSDDVLKEHWEGLTFAEFLTDIRESDEVSQAELSRRLGKSRQFIQAIETGKTNISLEMAKRIAEALGHFPEPFVEILVNEMVRKIGIMNQLKFQTKDAA